MQVVEEQHPWRRLPAKRQDHLAQAFEEARLSARAFHGRGGWQVAAQLVDTRQQASRFAQPMFRNGLVPALARRPFQGIFQSFDKRRICQVGLTRIAACRETGRAAPTGKRQELFCQTGLADPGLAFQDDHETIPVDGCVRLQQGGLLGLSPNKGQALDLHPDSTLSLCRGRDFFWTTGGDLDAELARLRPGPALLLDIPVQLGGLLQGRDPQLLLQDAHALLVLPQRGAALTCQGVELHHLPVGGLVQGIQRQPASGVGYGCRIAALGSMPGYQSFQRTGKIPPQALRLQELPVIEFDAVAQAEAGHEMVAVQTDCIFQMGQALLADVVGRVAVGLTDLQVAVELVHVYPQPRPCGQLEHLPAGL